jgi:hypothetical protein
MKVTRIKDTVRVYVEEGQLIFVGNYKTLVHWTNYERIKIGSDKKIHGFE